MDFIDWCDHVLDTLISMMASSYQVRQMGAADYDLARILFGQEVVAEEGFHSSGGRLGMHDALGDLVALFLVEQHPAGYFKPTRQGEEHAADKIFLWEMHCLTTLKLEQGQLLRVVNRLSPQGGITYAELNWIENDVLLSELNWPDGLQALHAVSQELADLDFVDRRATGTHLAARYGGLVWEFRKGFTMESRWIDAKVAEWETTSVEFKRELNTDTADEKAELIKDVIALANTQASGERWLLVGFDDKTHAYHRAPPDPRITQEHIEQLMSQYTEPAVDIRYEVVDYRDGPVGKLEVIRDARKVPHRVAKAIGDKKRIKEQAVFVRHGSLVEEPTSSELLALEEEGSRARAL